jgi:hypothetical protein
MAKHPTTLYTVGYTPDALSAVPQPLQAPILNVCLPSSGSLENQTTDHTRRNSQAAHDCNTHQAFLGNLVIDERPKAGGL